MAKIGIYGGTFNPVHIEHVALAKNIKKEFGLDRLFILPTYITPLKKIWNFASSEDRLNMLKIAFRDIDGAEISDYEIKSGGNSYTYLTLKHFYELFPKDNLYFILGADSLSQFGSWKFPEKIVEFADIICADRENSGIDIEKERLKFERRFKKPLYLSSYLGKDVSSTDIKVKKLFNLPCTEKLDKGVEEYIDKKGLYLSSYYTAIVNNLKPSRIIHTAGVVKCALKKVSESGLQIDSVVTACSLHDIAKYLSPDDYKGCYIPEDMPPQVIHSHLGSYYAEHILKIKDKDILNAIRYHTSGRPNMSVLEKLVFTADMLEEGRDYQGVEELRKYYDISLEEGFYHCLEEELLHLKNKGRTIYKDTLSAYEYYKNEREKN